MDAANDLADTQLFDGLSPGDLATFAGISLCVNFGPEEVVYEMGTAGDSLYVIVSGEFAVRVADKNDDEVQIAVLKAGSYFGEMEVIGGMNRTASVVSLGDGRCYQFDAGELLGLLKRNEQMGAWFYREVSRGLIKRLQNTTRDMGYFKSQVG